MPSTSCARAVRASSQQQQQQARPAAKKAGPAPRVAPRPALAGVLAGANAALVGAAQAALTATQGLSYEPVARALDFGSSKAPAEPPAVAAPSLPAVDLPSVDLPTVELPGDLSAFLGENGLLVAGAAALVVALPLAVNALSGGGGGLKAKSVPAARVLEALAAGSSAVLVDIRPKGEAKATGSPDLRSVKKAAVQLPLFSVVKGEPVLDEGFGAKLASARGVSEEATLILLDSNGTTYGAATKAVAEALPGLQQLYSVAGGAEGWQASGAPWRAPSKGLSLPSVDLKALGASLDALAEDFKEAPTVSKGLLGIGAIFGASFLLFNSVEALLEVAGVLAAGQFALKLLFAEEREQIFTEIKTIVKDKVALQDAGKDLKKIATTLLEEAVELQEGEEGAAALKKAIEKPNNGSVAAAPPAPAAAPAATPAAPVPAASTEVKGFFD